jgi:hypothetical protein
MKKLFLIFALGANAYLNAQGWVGNSVNNSIVPYNSSLGLSPMNVGIGVISPSEQLHTNSGVRFEGLQRNDTPNRIIVQSTTGKLFWRDASSIGGANNWSLTGNNNAVNPGVAANQNYLGTSTNHRVVFATGGFNTANQIVPMERMTILPGEAKDGSVGIGTSTPTSLLTIGNGSSGLGNQANQDYLFKSVGSADSTVEHLGFFNNDQRTSRSEITISNSGNAAGRWEDNFIAMMVHGDNFTYLGRNDYYLGQNNSGYAIINAQSNTGDSSVLRKFSIGVRNSLTPMSFYTNNIERIFIQGNGNVGVGTITPNSRLEVAGIPTLTNNSTADAVAAINTSRSGLRINGLRSTTPTIPNPGTGLLSVDADGDVIYVSSPTSSLTSSCTTQFYVPRVNANGSPNLTCSQILDNGTSVSIGGQTPEASLDVRRGTANAGFRARGTLWHSDFNSGTNEHTYVRGGRGSLSNVYIKDYTGGGVGIGHQPTNFSYSTGTILGAPTTGTATVSISGITTASGFAATSDETVKTDIMPITKALGIVKKLNGKSYLWTKEYQEEASLDNGRHLGFLAQELEKVLPEAVIKFEEGRYAVDYNSIIPVLTEAVKELNAKVEKQNNAVLENEELKAKIAVMEEKFALLEKTITQLCESGCAGLKKSEEGKTSEVDVLYQSIPNPTDKDALVNYFLTKEDAKAKIVLFTQEGKDMESHNLEPKKGNGSIKLSLDGLSNGTYLYSLIVEGKVIDTKRLQIVK